MYKVKEYVGLSKSSSAVKRCHHSPLVLQTSCSIGEDDYPPLCKPKADQRKSQISVRHRPRVLDSQVLAPRTKYLVACRFWESIVRDRQTLEMCPEPCWQEWEVDIFWERAWGKCKQHFSWFYSIEEEALLVKGQKVIVHTPVKYSYPHFFWNVHHTTCY